MFDWHLGLQGWKHIIVRQTLQYAAYLLRFYDVLRGMRGVCLSMGHVLSRTSCLVYCDLYFFVQPNLGVWQSVC